MNTMKMPSDNKFALSYFNKKVLVIKYIQTGKRKYRNTVHKDEIAR